LTARDYARGEFASFEDIVVPLERPT